MGRSVRVAKIALVGCGNPARRWHLPTLAELAKRGAIEFVALCDLDATLAAECGTKYGIPYYTDIDQMLDRHQEIMAVDVVTGDPTHHAIARRIAERGKHVMVEKPMAMTRLGCDVIIDACRRNGVHFEVAENYFRMPKQRALIQLIEQGVLGEIVRVYYVEQKARNPFEPAATHRGLTRPLSKFGNSSGMCMDMGAHRLSQLRLFAQSEPTQIAGTVRRYRADPEIVHEDWAHAMIDFESGAVGVYETSRLGESLSYYQVTGTQGSIRDHDWRGRAIPLRLQDGAGMRDVAVEFERHRVDGVDVISRIVAHTDPEIVYVNPFREYAIDDWSVGHAEEIMSLARAALGEAAPEYGPAGRKDVEMAMAIYESSLNGAAPVRLPIEGMTSYERMLHDDYRARFGQAFDAA